MASLTNAPLLLALTLKRRLTVLGVTGPTTTTAFLPAPLDEFGIRPELDNPTVGPVVQDLLARFAAIARNTMAPWLDEERTQVGRDTRTLVLAARLLGHFLPGVPSALRLGDSGTKEGDAARAAERILERLAELRAGEYVDPVLLAGDVADIHDLALLRLADLGHGGGLPSRNAA